MAYLLQPARSVALIALLTVLYVVVRLTFLGEYTRFENFAAPSGY